MNFVIVLDLPDSCCLCEQLFLFSCVLTVLFLLPVELRCEKMWINTEKNIKDILQTS